MGRTSLGQVAMALLKASSSDQSPVQNFCRGQTAATSQELICKHQELAETSPQSNPLCKTSAGVLTATAGSSQQHNR